MFIQRKLCCIKKNRYTLLGSSLGVTQQSTEIQRFLKENEKYKTGLTAQCDDFKRTLPPWNSAL